MPLPVPHPFGHVNLNVCPGRGPRPLAARPTGESLSQWGQVCICCSSAQGAGNSRPSLPLTACQLSRLKRRPKENNKLCSTSREKKQRKINERQKTKNSRNIFLKGEQRSVLEINTQLKPFANGHAPTPTARTWHICCRTIDAACIVARWHGELS